MRTAAYQQCINPACKATYDVRQVAVACTKCGSLVDVRYDWSKLPLPRGLGFFEHRWSTKGTQIEGRLDFSGVWRIRELMPFYDHEDEIVTIGEGRTTLQQADLLGARLGMKSGSLLLNTKDSIPAARSKTTA